MRLTVSLAASGFGVGPLRETGDNLRILHLSDLHLADRFRHGQEVVLDAMFKDMQAQRPPDVVVFSGDLAFSGGEAGIYELANEKLFDPLCKVLSIDRGKIVIVPGNHDLNMNKVFDVAQTGFRSAIKSASEVDEQLAKLPPGGLDSRFAEFEAYRSQHFPHQKVVSDGLATVATFVSEESGLSASFALTNTAWLSTGAGDAEYGELALGESQLRSCVKTMAPADLQIVVGHHPITWLVPFEQTRIETYISKNFHLLLTGHTHEETVGRSDSDRGAYIYNQAGCLFQGRDYENSYSWIEIQKDDSQDFVIETRHRVYSKKRDEFGSASASLGSEDQTYTLSLTEKGVNAYHSNDFLVPTINAISVSAVVDLKTRTSQSVSEFLGSNAFVRPRLTRINVIGQPGLAHDDTLVEDLMADSSNLILHGERESGKTLALAWLLGSACESNPNAIPAFVDLGLRSTKNISRKRVSQSLNRLGLKPNEIEEKLGSSNLVIALDNFDPYQTGAINALLRFTDEFKSAQILVSARKDVLLHDPALMVQLDRAFVQLSGEQCTTADIRSLVHFYKDEAIGVDALVQHVVQVTQREGMSRLPFAVTLVILAFEPDDVSGSCNRAALVDRYCRSILLGDIGAGNEWHGADMEDRLFFLRRLARRMHRDQTTGLSRQELELFGADHLMGLGRENVAVQLAARFIACGILLEAGEMVIFRHPSLRQYFAAQESKTDSAFRCELTASLLGYSEELDFASASSRTDAELISIVADRASACRSSLPDELFAGRGLPVGMAVDVDHLVEVAKVEAALGPESDEDLDKQLPSSGGVEAHQRDKLKSADAELAESNPLSEFAMLARLLGTVARNGEHLEDRLLRQEAIAQYLAHQSELFLAITSSLMQDVDAKGQLYDMLVQQLGFDGSEEDTSRKLKSTLFCSFFAVFAEQNFYTIGTESLKIDLGQIFEDVIADHPLCALQVAALACRIGVGSSIPMMERVLNTHKDVRWLATLAALFLSDLAREHNTTTAQRKRLTDLLAGIVVQFRSSDGKVSPTERDRIRATIQKKLLMQNPGVVLPLSSLEFNDTEL